MKKQTVITELGNGTAEVNLSGGLFALIDCCDIDKVKHLCWFASTTDKSRTFYARGRLRGESSKIAARHMHRVILCFPLFNVDHINGNGLDNRRCNLRFATHQQNCCNLRPKLNKTSTYRGVYWNGISWSASIRMNMKLIYLGRYQEERLAAAAYDIASLQLHGAFGVRNLSSLCAPDWLKADVLDRINSKFLVSSN